jgi:voltage-gated potassium channel
VLKKTNKHPRFINDVLRYTSLLRMSALLIVLWLLFSGGVYLAERDIPGTSINSYGRALYWGVAAFSTAGIADMLLDGTAEIIGALWIVIGSLLFFGTSVATVTTYFMRPLQRPLRQIIETVEYNLEQLDSLTVDELEILKTTVTTLIEHAEQARDRKLRLHPKAPAKAKNEH